MTSQHLVATSGMPEDLKYEQCRLQTFQRAGWSRVYAEQLAAAGLFILESQPDGKSGVHGGMGFHAFMGSRLPDLIAAMLYLCKLIISKVQEESSMTNASTHGLIILC